MNDTPETEKAEFVYNGNEASGYVEVEFAQKLERERDQWRECAERLYAALVAESPRDAHNRYPATNAALAEFDRLKGATK